MNEKKVTFEDIQKANETIKTISIARKDKKTGKTIKKNYAEVSQRIKAFRMVYPIGTIITEMISNENGVCTFKATIRNEKGEVLAIAHAQENTKSSVINATNFIENCETSAVGRALGMCGFGVDVSLSSAEDVQNATDKQEQLDNEPMTEEQLKVIAELDQPLKEQLREYYKKDPIQLTKLEATISINSLIEKGLIKTKKQEETEKKEKEEVF